MIKVREIEIIPLLLENVPEEKQGDLKRLIRRIMKDYKKAKVIRKAYDKNRNEYFVEIIVANDDSEKGNIIDSLKEAIKSI